MPDEFEREKRVIPVDANLPDEVKKIVDDGWQIDPEIQPVAVYHLVRPIKRPGLGIKADMRIDDTKIGILRADGSFEHHDGRIEKPA